MALLKQNKSALITIAPEKSSSSTLWLVTLTDLYLVILVFFILLNNISARDKAKNDRVVNSVNHSFTGTGATSDLNIAPQIFDFPTIIDNYFKSIQELLQRSLRLKNIDITRSDNTMVVTIPADALFDKDSVVIKEGQSDLLKKLEAILLQDVKGAKIAVQININSVAALDSAALNNYETDIARVKLFVNSLISSGMAGDMVSGSISFGRSNDIIMIFNVAETPDHKQVSKL